MSFKCCLFLQFLIPIFVLVIWLGIFFFTKLCLYVCFFFCFFHSKKIIIFWFWYKNKNRPHFKLFDHNFWADNRQWWASFNTLLYCQVLEGLLGFLQASNVSNHFFSQGTFLLHFFLLKMYTETCLFYHFVPWILQVDLKCIVFFLIGSFKLHTYVVQLMGRYWFLKW